MMAKAVSDSRHGVPEKTRLSASAGAATIRAFSEIHQRRAKRTSGFPALRLGQVSQPCRLTSAGPAKGGKVARLWIRALLQDGEPSLHRGDLGLLARDDLFREASDQRVLPRDQGKARHFHRARMMRNHHDQK